MFGLSTGELVLIAVVLVLLFGAKRIPELAKGIGESVRHLKKGIMGEIDDNNGSNNNTSSNSARKPRK
jgi:sec-independent protein translocase protein TatA